MRILSFIMTWTFGLGAFTALAHAENQGSRFHANLWIDDVACMGNGQEQSALRVQARYFDSSQNQIPNLPMFVQYSPNPEYPWAFAVTRAACEQLVARVNRLSGKLVPVDAIRVLGKSTRTATYPCGPANHMTGDRGTCTRTVPVNTVYVQYDLDGLLFTSWAEGV